MNKDQKMDVQKEDQDEIAVRVELIQKIKSTLDELSLEDQKRVYTALFLLFERQKQ
jgi:hypothetical protein